MRIYISGPITNTPGYEKAFDDAAARIRELGHDPVNPAWVRHHEPRELHWNEWMRRDLRLMVDCDAIYQMPGSVGSAGCALEDYVAQRIGLLILNSENLVDELLDSPSVAMDRKVDPDELILDADLGEAAP